MCCNCVGSSCDGSSILVACESETIWCVSISGWPTTSDRQKSNLGARDFTCFSNVMDKSWEGAKRQTHGQAHVSCLAALTAMLDAGHESTHREKPSLHPASPTLTMQSFSFVSSHTDPLSQLRTVPYSSPSRRTTSPRRTVRPSGFKVSPTSHLDVPCGSCADRGARARRVGRLLGTWNDSNEEGRKLSVHGAMRAP
jgi:hypothetical protein